MPLIEVNDIADPTLAPQLAVYEHRRDSLLLDWPGTEHGVFIGESANVIERAMDAGIAPRSFFLERKWLERTMPLIERAWELDPSIPAFVGTHEQFRAVTTYEITRGALAAFPRPALPGVGELLAEARRVAILEDIRNYTNVGAIFRSAAALGVDAVLVTPGCHDPYYRRAARVSMGAVFQVPWTQIGSAQAWALEGIPLLHTLGFKVAALALEERSIPLDSPELHQAERLAFVLGTESEGLSPTTIATCDYVVKIPMQHGVDSLNVAAASALAFWETRPR